ncbi:MAG: hypothetical protein ACRD8O_06865, partial [Bryobacteraceae bacterium]
VTIRAVDTNGTATAQSSYNIRALAEVRAQLSKTQGDTQNGAPGALLPQKLRVTLRDDSGNPIIGAAVVFNASPGAQIVSASAGTGDAGQAEASVRLPLSEGVALFSVEAARAVTTFSARAASVTLDSFPRQVQAAERGALAAAASSIVRFHQNRGDLPSTAGFAEPARVAQFLRDFCAASSDGQLCDGVLTNTVTSGDVLNLWRLAAFVNNQIDLSAEPTDLPSLRSLLAEGSPVLLSLTLTSGAATFGGNVVAAIGIAGDGSILIHDPDPAYARSNLTDYLNGFVAGNRQVRGTIAGALRFNLKAPPATGFLLASVAEPFDAAQSFSIDVLSAAGSCGRNFEVTDSGSPLTSRFRFCDGSQSIYQLDLATAIAYRATLTALAQGGRVTELAGGGSNSYKLARVAGQLSLGPLDVTFTPASVVNAATFEPGIAPGSLAAIFGAGLSGASGLTTVEFGGAPAQVVSRSPFQLNIEVPIALSPGPHNVRIQAPHGAAEQTVEVRQNAPAIFLLGVSRQGAVVNQDGRLNSPVLAARRGQAVIIYATGLGAVDRSGALSIARLPVSVVLNGRPLPAAFAGLAPGFVGLYQVNVPIPADTPPGLNLPLLLRQNGADSNAVVLALQ